MKSHKKTRQHSSSPGSLATHHDYGTRLNLEAVANPLMGRAGIWNISKAFPETRASSGPLYEISYVYDGVIDMELDNGSRLSAHGGDIYLLQPGTFHRCAFDVMMPCTYLLACIWPNPPWPCPPFTSMEEMEKCLNVLKSAGNRVVRACPESHAAFLALRTASLRHADSPESAPEAVLTRSLLFEAFSHMLRSLSASARTPEYEAVQRAMRFIAQHLTKRVSKVQIARASGLSAVHLYELFHKQTGITPAKYRMRLRLNKSMEKLLKSSEPITNIALEFAFASSQHFAQCFKNHFGMTPSACRRMALKQDCSSIRGRNSHPQN